MSITKILLFIAALLPSVVLAQSSPNGTITNGQVWTPAQWNAAWQSKLDYPGSASNLTTGTLAVSVGGTGDNTLTTHGVLLGSGTSAVGATATGTAGQCLLSNGSSADPSFQACPSSGGAVSSVSGSGLVSASPTTGAVVVSMAAVAGQTLLGNSGGSSAAPIALAPSAVVGLLVGQNASTLASGADSRFSGPPQNAQSTSYTLTLSDAGRQIYHPSTDVTARTWTIPANSSVGFSTVTKIDLVNDCSAGVVTVSVTLDTLVWLPTGATGSRSLGACGEATLTKVGATRWLITGTGLY